MLYLNHHRAVATVVQWHWNEVKKLSQPPQYFTPEEAANLLKVSKLTVYNLIKKGKLPAYRVGRQIRIAAEDLDLYQGKRVPLHSDQGEDASERTADDPKHAFTDQTEPLTRDQRSPLQPVICGQDLSLDLLARYIEKQLPSYRPLRSYAGSLNSLFTMFHGQADIVSTHLFDGETEEYNLPWIKRILTSHRYIVLNLIQRNIGFYVSKGNPKGIKTWEDLRRKDVALVNREKGSGARIFLDENLHQQGISQVEINGYAREETSHLSVAGIVASGEADVGIGIEQMSLLFPIDFIPLRLERYDLVILKNEGNQPLIDGVKRILSSPDFKQELRAMGRFDLSYTGKTIAETS